MFDWLLHGFIALVSGVVSLSVVGGGVYLYTQKDAMIENAKEQIIKAATGALTDALPSMVDSAIPELPGATGGALPSVGGGAGGIGLPF